eukprot:TCALIF_12822-PA protein Name:"Similar to Acss1 Acetyl-coenzyme A synthetase 2-like, mitochondrial (Mus musculus)" AED:0.25 eAED:0.25 QI:0/0/0/0.90/0.9/0.81/11/0/623
MEEFWGGVARSSLKWMVPFQKAMNCDMKKGQFEWFQNGKINASVNCIDRHVEVDPERIALIWEKDEPGTEEKITYRSLFQMTNQIANLLRRHNVKKGDVVALYMPVSPLAVASMLACSRIGAIHNVIFAGFSADAIATRVQDCNAVVLITADEGVRGGKTIPLKQTVDKALGRCPSVKNVFVMRRTGAEVPMATNHFYFQDLMEQEKSECAPESMQSEDSLFLLYTSGSTGKPKGLVHSTGGYLTYAGFTHKTAFNYQVGDIFGCVADIGWVTGHTYVVYGPLLNGGASVLFESTPTYPDPGRYWETVERLKISQFYGAPTAIRLLLRYEESFVNKYDRSSLQTLGSVGEPINVEAWEWFNDLVGEGRCDLVDTWWQSETGGICLTPRPSEEEAEILPGKPMRPMFGIEPTLFDEKGNVLTGKGDLNGSLCLKTPWPGMARTIFGDHERYVNTYFKPYPGYFFTGDGGHRDPKGYWQITGRMDDVINVTGHRLGTAEVEDVLDEHHDVAEAAVVGFPHPIKGEGVYAYVVLKEHVDTEREVMLGQLREMVKKGISGFAVPDHIQFCSGLPKTRSGKIMRRILRQVAANNQDNLGDISTLADPGVVDEIVKNHEELQQSNWEKS